MWIGCTRTRKIIKLNEWRENNAQTKDKIKIRKNRISKEKEKTKRSSYSIYSEHHHHTHLAYRLSYGIDSIVLLLLLLLFFFHLETKKTLKLSIYVSLAYSRIYLSGFYAFFLLFFCFALLVLCSLHKFGFSDSILLVILFLMI